MKHEEYINHVRSHDCLFCGDGAPNQAHHIRWGNVGIGQRPSDYKTIPLCLLCHDLIHNNPKKFTEKIGREDVFECMVNLLVEWLEIRDF